MLSTFDGGILAIGGMINLHSASTASSAMYSLIYTARFNSPTDYSV